MPLETIFCGACQARVTSDLVTPPELERLRSSFSRAGTGVPPVEDAAAPVFCPWCGVGELTITDVTEEDDPVSYTYEPRPRPRAPDEPLVVDYHSASKHEWCDGYIEVTPSDPDYELWCWISDRRKRYSSVTDKELELIRNEFSRWQRSWFRWVWHRLTHPRRPSWVLSGREL